MELIGTWISENNIELIGTVLGIVYVFFSIRQNILTWPTGLLSSLLYVWVFFVSKLYADMSLQIYYVVVSIYGWYEWMHGNKDDGKVTLEISRVTLKSGYLLTIISFVLFLLIWFVLKKYTDSPVPAADALATALSLVATWMLARKILEHWLVWIFVDTFSIGLFLYKELFPTVFLFIVYTIMAILGYFEWKKAYIKTKSVPV